jgi:hypothetical protein
MLGRIRATLRCDKITALSHLIFTTYLSPRGDIALLKLLKERIVREVGYALLPEGASAADFFNAMQANT